MNNLKATIFVAIACIWHAHASGPIGVCSGADTCLGQNGEIQQYNLLWSPQVTNLLPGVATMMKGFNSLLGKPLYEGGQCHRDILLL